jgi:hypothetical protein
MYDIYHLCYYYHHDETNDDILSINERSCLHRRRVLFGFLPTAVILIDGWKHPWETRRRNTNRHAH